jgi:hypothetical protein
MKHPFPCPALDSLTLNYVECHAGQQWGILRILNKKGVYNSKEKSQQDEDQEGILTSISFVAHRFLCQE